MKAQKYFNKTFRKQEHSLNCHKALTRQDKQNQNTQNLSTGDNGVHTAELNDKSINNHYNKLREPVQTKNKVLIVILIVNQSY